MPKDLIKKYTPESPEVTRKIARRLPSLIEADIYIAITGLTTSGGSENEEKPVGTMFVHLYFNKKDFAYKFLFVGTQEEIILKCIDKLALCVQSIILEKQ